MLETPRVTTASTPHRSAVVAVFAAPNQPQHAHIVHALLDQLHQQFMVDRVEVALEIEIDQPS